MDAFFAAGDKLAYAAEAGARERSVITQYALDEGDLVLFFVASVGGDPTFSLEDVERLSTPENMSRVVARLSDDPTRYSRVLYYLGMRPNMLLQDVAIIVAAFTRVSSVTFAAHIVFEHGTSLEILEHARIVGPERVRFLLFMLSEADAVSDEVIDWALSHFAGAPVIPRVPDIIGSDTRLGNKLIRLSHCRVATVERIANMMPGALSHFRDWEVRPTEDVLAVAAQFILHGYGRKLHPSILLKYPELQRYARECGVQDYIDTHSHLGCDALPLVLMTGHTVSPRHLADMIMTSGTSKASPELIAYISRHGHAYTKELRAAVLGQ